MIRASRHIASHRDEHVPGKQCTDAEPVKNNIDEPEQVEYEQGERDGRFEHVEQVEQDAFLMKMEKLK